MTLRTMRIFDSGQKKHLISSFQIMKQEGNTLDCIFLDHETEDGNYFRGSRLPLKFRCMGLPPCAGWIKLNFSGRGYDGHTPAGFGGIFHDQFNDCIGSYHGSLGEADAIVAGAETLREGIRCIQRVCPVRRLIIEGDELRVILWLNEVLLYPSMIKVQMLEVFDFLKNKMFVVGHIHEEANSAAIELAKKGTASQELTLWIADLPTLTL